MRLMDTQGLKNEFASTADRQLKPNLSTCQFDLRAPKKSWADLAMILNWEEVVYSETRTSSTAGQVSDAGDLRRTCLLIHPLNEPRLCLRSVEQHLQYQNASFHLQ